MTGPSSLRVVMTLALPIVLGNVSHTVVSLVDTLMVGRLGEVPLAALGAATSIFLVLFLAFSALVQGVQVICARRLGEGRVEVTGAVLQNGLISGLLLGIVALVTGLLLPQHMMHWFTPPGAPLHMEITDAETVSRWGGSSTEAIATGYLHWRWAFGMPLVILVFVFKGFFWGIGITRLDLAVSLVINCLNVFLNWLLIFGNLGCPRLGAPGAGLASAIANGAAVLIYVFVSMRREFRAEYGTFRGLRPDTQLIGRILKLSLARSVQGLAFGASAWFFAIIGSHVGATGLAVSTAIWRLFGILVLIGVGIGTAASTLVGRELGAGNHEAAAGFARAAVRLGALANGLLGALCFVFARPILEAFDLHAAAVEAGVPVFRMMALLQILDVCGIILSKALVGAGQVYFVMLAEILVAWGVCIPLCYVCLGMLRETNALLGAWLGWAGYIIAWALIMYLRWRQGGWRTARV